MADADAALVHGALAGLGRALARIPGRALGAEQHASSLEPALAGLRDAVEKYGTVTVAVEPGALRFEGERVYADELGAAGFCSRLYRDGVRALTFGRGLMMPDLLAFALAAVPGGPEGESDAVEELWKADLGGIQYTAARGDRLDATHPAAAAFAQEVQQLAARASEAVEYVDADATLLDRTQPPPLWSEEQHRKNDPQSWSEVARRAALTIERIVEEDLAGWDLEALQESFGRVLDEMARRTDVPALVAALHGVTRMGGAHAPSFRAFVGRRLADVSRLSRAAELATAPVKAAAQLLPAWTALLPDDAGPALIEALRNAREDVAPALAAAAGQRCASCPDDVAELLRDGPAAVAQAALSALPEPERGALALEALANADAEVRRNAVPLLASDPRLALERLAPLLDDPPMRAAAAEALSSSGAPPDEAAAAIVERLSSSKLGEEDLGALYRALGRLGGPGARAFLSERLTRPAKGFLKRRRSEQEQLLAVEALAADGSMSALRLLEEAADPKRGHAPAVSSACLAAVERLRSRRQVREGER
ncbi:MAG: hypothetical protein E6J64_02170 [Deltaproteobacteria bacterium]|nr:MAG: hypothetical protein E6J64_02170 [Deltaproteobacteria bacterium]